MFWRKKNGILIYLYCMSDILNKTGKRNPFNSKGFTMIYKGVDSLFKSIDSQLKSPLQKHDGGEFTQSQIELDNIIKCIINKTQQGIQSSLSILDDIIENSKKQNVKLKEDKLEYYNKFSELLQKLVDRWNKHR
jgi:hypothetical protein